jgi:hypothetical protein
MKKRVLVACVAAVAQERDPPATGGTPVVPVRTCSRLETVGVMWYHIVKFTES